MLIAFKCADCQIIEERISAPFEITALCLCGGLMLRLDEDLSYPKRATQLPSNNLTPTNPPGNRREKE